MGYCEWAGLNERYREYHVREWGRPVHDDRIMFEHLSLECLQCGLSWDLMLKKREIFRQCFDGFDFETIAQYGDADVARILATKDMLRSEAKIRALIGNAKCFLQVRTEYGSFCDYLWGFTNGCIVLYEGHDTGTIPVRNGLSKRISRDLKKRGFKYVGEITVYSHMQACGMINDHDATCPCRRQINESHPTVVLPRDEEAF